MYFNTKQISGLQATVDRYHLQFILEQAGLDALSATERKVLQNAGVDLATYKGKRTPVEEAFLFGKAESSVRNKKGFNRLDLKQFRQFMDENPGLFKLTSEDRKALKLVKQQFANDVKRLASGMKHDLEQNLIEIGKTTTSKTPRKQILAKLGGALAESNKRYSGRFELVSSYNMHATFQEGITQEILQRLGPNAKVYFSVHPDACDKCVKLYLKAGRGSQPKVFLLNTILKNGSNIGRKPGELKPSRYPVHPRCRCKMNLLPKGKVKFSAKQNHYIRIFE